MKVLPYFSAPISIKGRSFSRIKYCQSNLHKNLELTFINILVISGLDFGYVPCKGYRSSQLISWASNSGTGPKSHLCNGIIDCIDRSDESGCQDLLGSSEVGQGRNLNEGNLKVICQFCDIYLRLLISIGKN